MYAQYYSIQYMYSICDLLLYNNVFYIRFEDELTNANLLWERQQ